MDLKKDVDPEVCEVLKKIIVDSKDIWTKDKQTKETSLDSFLSYGIPKGNINTTFSGPSLCELNNDKLLKVQQMLNADSCSKAGYMHPNSCMFWHTNSNNVGQRIYYTFSTGRGIFRYLDRDGKIKEDWDNKGWTKRVFNITDVNPFWHSVWAEKGRFSFGFFKKLP